MLLDGRMIFFPRKTTTMFSSRKTVLIHNFSTARHLHKECHCKKSHIIPETLFLTNRKETVRSIFPRNLKEIRNPTGIHNVSVMLRLKNP